MRIIRVSLSKPIITDWLRNELGFDGVVMTDDIEVGAAVAGISIEGLCGAHHQCRQRHGYPL